MFLFCFVALGSSISDYKVQGLLVTSKNTCKASRGATLFKLIAQVPNILIDVRY